MNLRESLQDAFAGIVHVVQSETNARIHLAAAAGVLVLSVLFGVSNTDLAIIFFAIIIVFVAEITNSALEKTLDIVSPQLQPKVKVIKDMTAGAVLVAAIGAAAIGLVIFYPYVLGWLWQH
jgi:diacylglycerol kinase